ncbi:CRISPR-associated helicase/endonuclease Cas3 [Magnetospirillum fulvum]|uniref:CRISPR-associated helicase/endonuclease Cas3 n=1 Tax=Magnetospirillum fulvum TaxID=1082 RepID=UPI0009450C4C
MIGIKINSVPWGKTGDGDSHHLIHHCADVAACFEVIATLPVVRARLEWVAGRALSDTDISRLAVLAFLHDVGKVHPGFQAKGWPEGLWKRPLHGHVQEGAAIFLGNGQEEIARNLNLAEMIDWGLDSSLLLSVLAHHGRTLPANLDPFAERHWETVPDAGYDPVAVAADIGAMILRWFPSAFVEDGPLLPTRADFAHLLCGFVSLADWLGSTRSLFPFRPELDVDYIGTARDRARRAVRAVGLDCRAFQDRAQGRSDFTTLTGIKHPRPQQRLVGDTPLDEALVILEAETGSGKTESALWRFVQLFEAGRVDSLYFALPTRAAAIQLQGRVNRAMRRIFGADAPEAVLAVPGYLIAGEAHGQALPGWEVRWDDDRGRDEQRLLARWAAESVKRYLAATIAVGTVDQAMLAALQVKHAHLRGAALSRSLLVIDEVHASDSYQVAVQSHLLRIHLGRGGYAMLMSATLGSVARTKWLGRRAAPSFAEAVATPYPAVWGKGESAPRSVDVETTRGKSVAMTLVPSWSAEQAAALALAAAREGAKVLVVRNTVTAAVATFEAIRASGGEEWLLSVAHGPALHHSRFAPEDRKLLDAAVEAALSPDPAVRGVGGLIVVGTQTLEQSLDIDADLLITDLCPVDVLLQRIGRLHRHALPRPPGFEAPRCLVLSPEAGLAQFLAPTFENGLGGWREAGVLNGIYRDLSVVELTRRLVVAHPDWIIPAMNRFLVESATHPEPIEALHRELGPTWETYRNEVYGKDVAEAGAAANVALPVTQPFAELRFPEDETKIRTRLGGEGARIVFAAPVAGPFGVAISGVTLPPYWSHGIDPDERVTPLVGDGVMTFRVSGANILYSRSGLQKRPNGFSEK